MHLYLVKFFTQGRQDIPLEPQQYTKSPTKQQLVQQTYLLLITSVKTDLPKVLWVSLPKMSDVNTNVHTLSLVELKQLAKINNPPIKYYYIKSRVELIQILTSEFTEEMKIEKMTIHQLRREAREKGHLNVWKMRRPQLIELLYKSGSSPKEDKKNDDHAQEHNNPEEGESKDVRVEV